MELFWFSIDLNSLLFFLFFALNKRTLFSLPKLSRVKCSNIRTFMSLSCFIRSIRLKINTGNMQTKNSFQINKYRSICVEVAHPQICHTCVVYCWPFEISSLFVYVLYIYVNKFILLLSKRFFCR